MNQNKIAQAILAVSLIVLGIWASVTTVSLDIEYQVVLIISAVIVTSITFIKRSLPFDYKFLVAVLWGYALGGKGFAYISPVEPIYIGEVALIICTFGLLYRFTRGIKIIPTKLHLVILLWMILVGIYLLDSLPKYGILAIRDSAMAYYGVFFFFSFAMFQNEKCSKAFEKSLKIAVVLGCISSVLFLTIWLPLAERVPALQMFFLPHVDAFIPLIVAGTVFCFLKGMSSKSILLLSLGIACLFLLLLNKTAGVFSFVIVLGAITVFAKRFDIAFMSVIGIILASLTIALFIAAGNSQVEKLVFESDSIQTISDIGGASGRHNSNTSDWRLSWWTIIAEDTWETNPVLGVGIGGDITSHFLQSVMRIDLQSQEAQNYARYPHNILFTVLGRMGFLGLALFLIPFFSIIVFVLRFISLNLKNPDDIDRYLIASVIVLSGITNGMVQSTYEVPHGAIMHWTCLGYLASCSYSLRMKTSRLRPASKAITRDELIIQG